MRILIDECLDWRLGRALNHNLSFQQIWIRRICEVEIANGIKIFVA